MSWPVAVAIGVVGLLLAWLALLFAAQRSVLFPAPRSAELPDDPAVELVRLPHEGGVGDAYFLPPRTAPRGPVPLLIFAHGNAELAVRWIGPFEVPRRWGWGVLLVEYPGYGQSAGSSSKASVERTMLAAFDWARADPRVDAGRLVLYGRSLGGAAAAHVAAHRPVAALILESAFTAVRPLAARFGVPGFLVRDAFDNLAALQAYRGPMLVLHGTGDTLIPVAHGRALAAAVPGAELEELPCGHNDCGRSWARIARFLEQHGLTVADPATS